MTQEQLYPCTQYLSEILELQEKGQWELLFEMVKNAAKETDNPWEIKTPLLRQMELAMKSADVERAKLLIKSMDKLKAKTELEKYLFSKSILSREFASECRRCQVKLSKNALSEMELSQFLQKAISIGKMLTLEEQRSRMNAYYIMYISWTEKAVTTIEQMRAVRTLRELYQLGP